MLETLTILGGGGWFPAHGRHTACALLRDGDAAIMIDAGTGVGRLVERPELLDGVTQLDIVLTHFHLDHVAGLAYLPALGLCAQTTVWGPGSLLYGTPTGSLLGSLSHEPFHPVPLEDQEIDVRDLPPGEIELAGVRIALRRQDRHSAPSLGLRFDDAFAWITDTAYDPESAPFALPPGRRVHLGDIVVSVERAVAPAEHAVVVADKDSRLHGVQRRQPQEVGRDGRDAASEDFARRAIQVFEDASVDHG